jgi:hypothetical protein
MTKESEYIYLAWVHVEKLDKVTGDVVDCSRSVEAEVGEFIEPIFIHETDSIDDMKITTGAIETLFRNIRYGDE